MAPGSHGHRSKCGDFGGRNFRPCLAHHSLHVVRRSRRFVNNRPTYLRCTYSASASSSSNRSCPNQSGGASINNCVIHVSSNHLPFGGLGNSSISSGHGSGFTSSPTFRGSTNSVLTAPEPCSCRLTPVEKQTGRPALALVVVRSPLFLCGHAETLAPPHCAPIAHGDRSAHLAAQSFIEHLDPPFWWVDMPVDTVQIMVYGDRVARLAPVVEYPGVSVARDAGDGRITRSSTCTSPRIPSPVPSPSNGGMPPTAKAKPWGGRRLN